MTILYVAHQSFGNFSVFPIRFYCDFWPLKAVMSDFCDPKCDREFSKINDSHFQHLGVIKIAKSSSNLALYFRMRFPILVHCEVVVFAGYSPGRLHSWQAVVLAGCSLGKL